MMRTANRALGAGLAFTLLLSACGGGAPTPTPAAPTTGAPTTGPGQTQAGATSGTAETQAPAATNGSTGPAKIDAPDSVQAGTQFDVTFTGPNTNGDYITIVAAGTAAWTNEPYFSTSVGSPSKLTAPSKAGAYELWYVSGPDSKILFRRPITVTAFTGSLQAPDSVMANTQFDVAWTGPNGPGDYVTIVKAGTAKWTNESYFNTSGGSPGKLLAPLDAGTYEIWYVIGSDASVQSRRTILVTQASATLQAPGSVSKGASFQVSWTGPAGPGDYVTIVPVGSPVTAYLSYFNTSSPSPGTLTAPDTSGDYEIWYVPGQTKVILAKVSIRVN